MGRSVRRLTCILAIVIPISLLSTGVQAEPPSDIARQKAAEKGIARLMLQLERGGLGGNYYAWLRCNHHAVAGLALLCEGHTWTNGKYSKYHRLLLDFCQKKRFVDIDQGTHYLGVWGHGYMLWYAATLAQTAPPDQRKAIDAFVVQLIKELSSYQSTESGGWGHHPKLLVNELGYNEFSVITSLSLSSLLRARELGYLVDEKVIDRAFRYLDKTVRGQNGAPRYSVEKNIAAGNQREGAPRGAMVMVAYSLNKRTTPAVRNLLKYLRQCKEFTGGHANAAVGMCHSALHFATIDDYDYFWELHGQNILDRQRKDGTFKALPPGERTDKEDGDDLSDAFHTLTIALPDAPWKLRPRHAPAIANGSMQSLIRRAGALVTLGEKNESLKKLSALDPNEKPFALARQINELLNEAIKESNESAPKPNAKAGWLSRLLQPYAFTQVIRKDDDRIDLQVVIPPVAARGLRAEIKVFAKGHDQALDVAETLVQGHRIVTKRMILRPTQKTELTEIRITVRWALEGQVIETTHGVLTASGA